MLSFGQLFRSVHEIQSLYVISLYIVTLLTNLSLSQDVDNAVKGQRTPLDMYKKLFQEHRAMQLEAVKSIQKFGEYKHRYKLVNITLHKLFTVIHEAKENLTMWGFVPGDPFPENNTIREGVSKVLENTAMFGDLALRLPDMVHDLYDKNKEWQLLIGWSYWFCKESDIFDKMNGKLLHLMAQEVNLIPREENFTNPFTIEHQLKQQMKEKETKNPQKKNAKKKKERKKGPRLSKIEL